MGCKVLYLPPYSPDYNPIETTFSGIKSWLKRYRIFVESCTDPKYPFILAFPHVTPDMAKIILLIEQKNITKKCDDINFYLRPIISIPNSFNKISGLISAICDTIIFSSSNFCKKFVYLLSPYCLSSSSKNSFIDEIFDGCDNVNGNEYDGKSCDVIVDVFINSLLADAVDD
ncbi:hypothetical protein RhiirC2_774034 [Rhizophagus irregularis]|uniref:Tc1-like transposase DDE domain-containing protein n=1 Tax=Rhizophagus irregularis TaxID=588596 RepID=A0A2N1NMN2_9GLOM|nr:hypothetical protein RhiirC2_774034 [Rhizophagus irregularis]